MGDVKKVCIVGAGIMGHGLAQAFAQGGYQVTLCDLTRKELDRAWSLIKSSLNTMLEVGAVTEEEIEATLGRITATTSLEEAASEADMAIEAVVEDKKVKQEIFARLDAICPPRTLLASNSSLFNIFDFVDTSRPDKVLAIHWYAPPQIIPVVDVVKGPETDEANIRLVVRMLREMGKKPVVFNKPVAGYALNRIQVALQREVYHILDNDYLTPADLDTAAIWGLALRMMVVGIVQRIDFGGLDLSARGLANASMCTPLNYKPRKLLELVQQGYLGVKAGRGFYDYKGRSEAEVCHDRDIRLLKLLKILQDTDLAGPVT